MTSSQLPTAGWIGTGHMGASLARRLMRGGLDVAVWNRTRAKAEALEADGATVVDSPADLASRDVVFTMVSASKDLEQVVLQVLENTDAAPRIFVDCSTVSTEMSEHVRGLLAERGTIFLCCPVSGNGKVAAAGLLTLVCSGPQAAYEELSDVLNLLGRHVTYVGEGENARLVKICHNLMLGVVAQTMAEITVLAEKGGVPRHAFLEFLNNSVMGSPFTRYKSPALVNLDWTPTFTPVLLRKDFDLGLAAASTLGVPLPVVAAAREPVQTLIAQGHVTEDFARLLQLQAINSGLELVAENVEVDDGLTPVDAD
jgi:3-hydroxyisobutyrate dehydrogenase